MELVSLVPAIDGATTRQTKQTSATSNVYAIHSGPHHTKIDSASPRDAIVSEPTHTLSLRSDRPSIIRRLILDSWICETIAMSFSIGCLVAIMIVVGAYDGQRIPQFISGLTLNTIISVLSTASRSSLIFVASATIGQLKWCWLKRSPRPINDIQAMDNASRGPLGAFEVLTSWTGGSLASLSSVTIILMVAFSPFLQQLVDYPTRSTIQIDAFASAPRNLAYTGLFSPSHDFSPFALVQNFSKLDRVVEAGVWSVQKLFDQEPTCSSGRCSWPKFQSVGWCSKCEDRINSATIDNCTLSTIVQNKTGDSWYCDLSLGHDTTSVSLLSDLSGTKDSGSATYTSEYLWTIYGVNSNPNYLVAESTTFLNVRDPLVVVGYATVRPALESDVRTDLDFGLLRVVEASVCILTLCERTLSLDRVNGTTTWNEESINYGNVTTEMVHRASPVGSSEGVGLPDELMRCWQAKMGEVDLVALDGVDDAVDKNMRAFCPVDSYAFELGRKLYGSQKRRLSISNDSATQATVEDAGPGPYDSSYITVATRNVSQIVESVAAALTNYGLATTNDTVLGDAFAEESYVHVRWQWLILPAFLELASLVLLVLTIVHSRREDVPIWKSSVLALMYHGADELQDRGTLASQRLSGMELIAKAADVQLVKNEDVVNSLERRSGYIAVTEDK
jgi:hypothetical protein